MKKCRTTTFVTYWIGSFDGKGRVFIDVYPQQKWEYIGEIKGALDRISIRRNNVTLEIPKTDFNKYWKVLDNE